MVRSTPNQRVRETALATKNDLYIMAFAIIGTNLAGVAMLLQFFG